MSSSELAHDLAPDLATPQAHAAARPAARTPRTTWAPQVFAPAPVVTDAGFEDLTGYISQSLSLRKPPAHLPAAQDFSDPAHAATRAGAATQAPPAAWAGEPTHAQPVADPHAPQAAAPDAAQAWRDAVRQELLDEMEAELAERQAHADAALAQQLHDARQAGYQDGYRDGLEALDSFKQTYAQQVTGQVAQLVQSMDRELQALELQVADAVAELAAQLARQVVRSELQVRPTLITQVAREAVGALLKGARQVTIALHPDDHALVAQGCPDLLDGGQGAHLLAQPGIARGGCVVESDSGSVDARIATRWQLAAQTMGGTVAWDDQADQPGDDA